MKCSAPAPLALGILGGVLGLTVLAPTSAAQSGAEALLPEGSILYAGSGDLDAFIQATKSKAMGRIISDEEVQEFLAKPMTMMNEMLSMGVDMAKGVDPDIEKKRDAVMASPYGKSFLAVTHVQIPDSPQGVPEVGLVMGLEPKAGAVDLFGMLRDMATGMAKEQGVDVAITQKSVGDATYDVVVFEQDGPPMCFATIRGTRVVSLSEGTIQSMLARAAGEGTSLESAATFQRGQKHVGASVGGSPLVYVHTGEVMGLIDNGLEIAQSFAEGEEADAIAKVKKGLDYSGFKNTGPVMVRSGWDGDVAVTKTYSEADPQGGALNAALLQMRGTVDPSRLALIPKNALSFRMTNFDLAPTYDAVMGGLKSIAPEIYQEVAMGMQGFAGQISGTDADGNPNWDLRRDLIGAFGGEYFGMTTPGTASMFGPANNTAMFIECANADGFQRSLNYVMRMASEQGGLPLVFDEEEYNGYKIQALDPSSMGPAAMIASTIQPTYALADGRLYMASSPKALKGLFDAMKAAPETSIAMKKDFMRHAGALPQQGLARVAYADTATNFEDYYNAALGAIPMIMMGAPIPQDELPVDISLLPTAEAVSQHLFGSASWSTKVGPGAYLSESRGPFGMELMAGIGAMTAAGFGIAAMRQPDMFGGGMSGEPMVIAEPQNDPVDQAWLDLRDISASITVYTVEFGSAPASLAELKAAKPNYPDGVLPRNEVPNDPWGNAYSYIATDSGFLLWSFGPNGVDDQGGEDDLKIDRR